MHDLISLEKIAQWQKLKTLVLDNLVMGEETLMAGIPRRPIGHRYYNYVGSA